jgi:riboflavin kinase/FMN adenylyltransferase
MVPANGVYAVKVFTGNEEYSGVMNIGNRPTFQDSESIILEVHIFDFSENIYDKEIKVEFVDRIRDEQKFNSKEELIEQINRDKAVALQILKQINN